MQRSWKPILLIAVIALVAVLVLYRGFSAPQARPAGDEGEDIRVGAAIGQRAPNFEALTLDGESLRLSDLRGRLVLVNVFASWCGPCRLETPHLVRAYGALDRQEVAIVGLNLKENPETVAGFRDEFGIDYPLILDEGGELTGDLYRPLGLPTSWFIDREGVVRYVFSGAMTEELLRGILEDVQAGRQPDPFAGSG